MESKTKTKQEIVLEERTPIRAKIDKKDLSKFKMKDDKFEGKFLTYIDKKSSKEGKVQAVHRNLVIARTKVTCWQAAYDTVNNGFLTKDEAGLFDKDAKEFWLSETKSSK